MKKKARTMRKALLTVFSAMLLVCVTIGATVAYLTSTATVTNTFTVGKVAITLDEADVKTDGTYETDATARVKANEYKLFPGHTYIKDPTIHVDKDSENCWLFVKVENNIDGIEAEGTTAIAEQMKNNGWTAVEGASNVYAYKEIVGAQMNIPVFSSFKIADTVTNDTLQSYAGKTVVVTAYAVQADGFGTAAAAWDAAKLS